LIDKKKIIVVGSGNAAFCAAIAALENGAEVLMLEKAGENEMGGNSRYTAGAMRFVYNSNKDLLPLLLNPNDEKIAITDFGSYSKAKFEEDLLKFNKGNPLSLQQKILVNNSAETLKWLSNHNVKFEPIYKRQTFKKKGKYIFWGGLTLAAQNEGVGLIEAELKEFKKLAGEIKYNCAVEELIIKSGKVVGVNCILNGTKCSFKADAVILACGGFEANPTLRKNYMGGNWEQCKVRGTRHNLGKGIEMALKIGAAFTGIKDGCHATPMDANMPNYGNLEIPFIDRKNYRKICYFLGVMLNADGKRFVDEGKNFRNYTYAQFGKAILNQPQNIAWQIFDSKVEDLLYGEYKFWDASFIEANTLEELVEKMQGIDKEKMLQTINEYNQAVDENVNFDPTILDGKSTKGLALNKTNWAQKIDKPPFKAFPVTCGITFTYAGLNVNEKAAVLNKNNQQINGLYACGELVGNVFYYGYPGGSGLTSGAVFGKLAGENASS